MVRPLPLNPCPPPSQPANQLTNAVGRRRDPIQPPRRGGGRSRGFRGDWRRGRPDERPGRAEGRSADLADPRRAGARAARGGQVAGPPAGAHVRAQRGLRGGGVQEAGRRAVLRAQDPPHQGPRGQDVGRVGWSL